LQRQIQIFGGFQFEDCEAAGAGDGKKIENAVLCGGLRKDLFVNALGKQGDIDAGDVLLNNGLQPTFGLGARYKG
jgi:hypothetical protein